MLWKKISDATGLKVTKSNFRYLLENQSLTDMNIVTESNNNNTKQIKGTILLIDDLAENLRFLTEILNLQGYKVRSVTNGKMALRTVKNSPPDLILLDVKMPNMNGYQVCELLKLNADSAEIPVIFLSALDEVIDKIKAFQVGGVDYIN